MADGEEGLRAVGFEIFRPILPCSRRPGRRRRGPGRNRACVGGVEARRDPHPDPSPRRGGAHLHAQPQRDHRHVAGHRRRRCAGSRSARRCSTARRCGWMPAGPAPFQYTVSQIDSGAPPEGIVTFLFDVLHVDGEDLLDPPLARTRRAARGGRAARTRSPASSPATRAGASACSTRRSPPVTRASWSRSGVDLRGGPARQGVAQGQAGAHLRPGRARRRMGARPPAGLALQPPPRRPRSGDGRLRHGGQDVQGADRRAAALADRGSWRARPSATGLP